MIDWDELTGHCNMRAKFLVVVLIECGGLYTENGLSAQPLCATTAWNRPKIRWVVRFSKLGFAPLERINNQRMLMFKMINSYTKHMTCCWQQEVRFSIFLLICMFSRCLSCQNRIVVKVMSKVKKLCVLITLNIFEMNWYSYNTGISYFRYFFIKQIVGKLELKFNNWNTKTFLTFRETRENV